MATVQARLSAINFEQNPKAIKDFLNDAQVHVNFWGTRLIKMDGIAVGSVALEKVTSLVLEAVNNRYLADNYTLYDRLTNLQTVKHLKLFYRNTDNLVQQSNIVTRILVWIREFSFNPGPIHPSTRDLLEDGQEFVCRGYQPDLFYRIFGNNRDARGDHPDSDGGQGNAIYAKEASIRNLFMQFNIGELLNQGFFLLEEIRERARLEAEAPRRG